MGDLIKPPRLSDFLELSMKSCHSVESGLATNLPLNLRPAEPQVLPTLQLRALFYSVTLLSKVLSPAGAAKLLLFKACPV